MERVIVCDLGRVPYAEAWDMQKRLQARLVRAKRAALPERIPHVLLLVEHPPVYTIGKSGDERNLLLPPAELAARGVSFYHVERGGDVTFHGPGQIVAYPILDLGRFFTDMHRYMRTLEESIIRTCADHGVTGGRVKGRTGVWIGPDRRGPERKIAALGVQCSRWVTMHGLALNVNTDLAYFGGIVPCGIADRGVTSLAQELGHAMDMGAVARLLVRHLMEALDADGETLTGEEAVHFLRAYLAGEGVRENAAKAADKASVIQAASEPAVSRGV